MARDRLATVEKILAILERESTTDGERQAAADRLAKLLKNPTTAQRARQRLADKAETARPSPSGGGDWWLRQQLEQTQRALKEAQGRAWAAKHTNASLTQQLDTARYGLKLCREELRQYQAALPDKRIPLRARKVTDWWAAMVDAFNIPVFHPDQLATLPAAPSRATLYRFGKGLELAAHTWNVHSNDGDHIWRSVRPGVELDDVLEFFETVGLGYSIVRGSNGEGWDSFSAGYFNAEAA